MSTPALRNLSAQAAASATRPINDQFDLSTGDFVYVEGILEGLLGCVICVSRQFKIKLSDYKRLIAKTDTHVQGQLFLCGSHAIAFDRNVLPYSKIPRESTSIRF